MYTHFVKGQGLSDLILTDDWNEPFTFGSGGYYTDPEPRKPARRDPKVRRDRNDRGKERIV